MAESWALRPSTICIDNMVTGEKGAALLPVESGLQGLAALAAARSVLEAQRAVRFAAGPRTRSRTACRLLIGRQ